ncbi:hypothetical protein [Crossiella sp. CA198]|uniref:hypothetical protein n=1 Tax=Crossiella sp. CA198 TaxID=3455607 RepID=UPI003F8D17CA
MVDLPVPEVLVLVFEVLLLLEDGVVDTVSVTVTVVPLETVVRSTTLSSRALFGVSGPGLVVALRAAIPAKAVAVARATAARAAPRGTSERR